MYLDFFKLSDFPFRLTPDTEFMYMSSAHTRAKAYMDYTVWNREGFVVITGDIGCGKTTLIKKLLSELDDEKILVAKIFQTQLDEVELLQAVLVEFGLNPFNAKKVELIDMLNTFLIDSYKNLRQIVLVVDDAHNLTKKALEEVRMLSGLETQKEKILHVILVGQPQLNEMLDAPEMEQLLQRVRLRFHLKALTPDETAEYVAHRLKVAGATREDLFTPETMPVIYRYTGGVPRLINTLCDTALTCAYADNVPTVTIGVVKAAIDELQWQTYERRMSRRVARDPQKGKGGRGARSESEHVLGDISARLGQLDDLQTVLSTIADRMGHIASLLSGIALNLQGPKPEHPVSKRAGSKDR
jgi:type II secretory pathway predicted ATPase ExeA